MGARTWRLVLVRLMAVCAICFTAIGHLLYSMSAGLDGYARLHMSVIAPNHKELDDLMTKNVNQRRGGLGPTIHMRQGNMGGMINARNGCNSKRKSPLLPHCNNISLKIKEISRQSGFTLDAAFHNGAQPALLGKPWGKKKESGANSMTTKDSFPSANNHSVIQAKHCPLLRLDFSKLIEVIKAKGTSPWQPVSPGNQSYVHSAYYDGRPQRGHGRSAEGGGRPGGGKVVIIGIVRIIKVTWLPRYCQFWYPEEDNDEGGGEAEEEDGGDDNGIITISRSPIIVPVKALKLNSDHTLRSAAYLYTCDVPSRRQPLGVSLVENACSSPTNYLTTIRQPPPKEKVPFTVCVPTLRPNFQDVDSLLQMVEINRMFGGDKFTFYVHSSGADVRRQLKQYIADNIASKVTYTFPLMTSLSRRQGRFSNDLYEALRMASVNDCLYRNMFRTKYIIFADADEMLVPRGFKKWVDMLKEVTDNVKESYQTEYIPPSIFHVKSVLFRTEWPDNPIYANNLQVKKLHLSSLLKTNREQIGLPGRDRPRFILSPSAVSAVGFGKLWGIDSQLILETNVPESMGLIHTYHPGVTGDLQGGVTTTPTPRMIGDHTLLAYYDVIVSRVLERHERVKRGFP